MKMRFDRTIKQILVAASLLSCGVLPAQEAGVPEGKARIIVSVDSLPEGNLGVHMLLDSEAASFGQDYSQYSLPSSITSRANWRGREQFYDTNFDYRIPQDASAADSLPSGLLNGRTDTLDILAGVYDYIVVYFYSGGYMSYVSGDTEKNADDAVFEAGYTYKYHVKSSVMLSYMPPFEIELAGVELPSWGHGLGTGDTVSIRVVNGGTERISRFKAGYQVNEADSVWEWVDCDLGPGDTLAYTFKQNPDFSEEGWMETRFFVWMEKDGDASNNSVLEELYHPLVRSMPFHDDFESADSLKHWQTVDFGGGYAGSWSVRKISSSLAALQTSACLQGSSSSNPAALYLVSDPFRVEAGIQHASFYYTGGSLAYPETIELRYGFSSDVAGMKVAGKVSSIQTPVTSGPPQLHNYYWEQAVFNIDFEQDSVYYFAIGIVSEAPDNRSHTVYVDEFGLDTGRYDMIPDIELISLILPPSTCTMAEDSIGLVIRNAGKAPMAGYSIAYRVNDAQWVEIPFSDSLQAGSLKTLYLPEKIDFSAVGAYALTVAGSCSGQDIFGNDTLEALLHHYDPVTAFPYTSDFSDTAGPARTEWHADTASKWTFDENGFWKASANAGKVHSRCMDLEPGVYRIALRCKAGYDDGYVTSYGSFSAGLMSLDGQETRELIRKEDLYTEGGLVSFDTCFRIEAGGTYTLYVDAGRSANFALVSCSVEEAFYNDLRLERFASSTLSAVMPESQINGETHVFSASFRNRGFNPPANPRIGLSAGGSENRFFEASDSIPFELSGAEAGTVYEIRACVVSDSTDEYPEDNTLSIRVEASDSVMAKEKAVIGKVIQDYMPSTPAGNIFQLVAPDTLTSITFAMNGSQDRDTMAFILCRVSASQTVEDTVCRQLFAAPSKAGFHTVAVGPAGMEPGWYFAALVSPKINPGYWADSTPEGIFYTQDYAGHLTGKQDGYMVLRLNLGPEKPLYPPVDLAVYAISGPQDSSLMASDEEITAQVVNYGNVAVEDAIVRWKIDGQEWVDTADLAAATAIPLKREADFSEVGRHEVRVEICYPNDPDSTNNALTVYFVCVDDASNLLDDEAAGLRVWPNPASSVVKVSSREPISELRLFDNRGECHLQRQGEFEFVEIGVAGLPAGVYFLQVKTARSVSVKKIVVHD